MKYIIIYRIYNGNNNINLTSTIWTFNCSIDSLSNISSSNSLYPIDMRPGLLFVLYKFN
jgi:hypothetical protein